MTRLLRLIAFACLLLGFAASARAANEGLPDLDKAIDLQSTAEDLSDHEKIVDLCESAITKGLDDENKKLANEIIYRRLYIHAAQMANAIFDVNKIFVRKPHNPQWQLIRNLAVKDLEKSIKLEPKQPAAHVLLARLYALPGGDMDKARAAASQAVETATDKDEDEKVLALIVRGSLQTVPEKQIADYDEAVKIAPEHAEALRARGMYHLLKQDFEKASADYAKVLAKNPDDMSVIGELAESLTAEKKFDEALKLINRIIDANPKSPIGYTARARILVLQGKNDEGLADLNKAVELDPKDASALLMRARYYYQQKEPAKAKADVDLALKLRPGMVQGILMQTELAAQQGKFEEAIENMRLMASADPMNSIWKVQIAQLLSADKRPRAAIEMASAVLKTETDNAAALRIRGDAYLGIGKHAEAVADLEAALKHEPDSSSILNNLAWVLATSPDAAVRNGKRAIELAQKACEATEFKRPHIISTLAAAHAEAGDFETAIKWSTKAVEMSAAGEDKPDDETQAQLKKELEGYKDKKPFREKQEIPERKPTEKPPREDLEV